VIVDTLSFFESVLPGAGPYYLVIFAKGKPLPAHRSYATLPELAAAAAEFDQKPGLSVYFACASYNEPFVTVEVDGVEKRKYRIEPNWQRAKALWCDIDCGEDKAAAGKGYATKLEAWQAIEQFCLDTDFPKPMVVDSGGGLHCYWPLTKAIMPAKWQILAGTLKSALQHFGVKADPSRTADFASILRPPGTHNKKDDKARPVSVKLLSVDLDPADLAQTLARIVDTFHVKREHVVRHPPPVSPSINDDLLAHLPVQVPSSALEVAAKCQQFRMIRDTGGQVGYDHWRGGAGIFKHCIEGAEMFHKWSQGDPNYDTYTAQVKVDTWSTGPTTCEFFDNANPGGCEGCEYKGKIKSPIMLGRQVPEPEEQVMEVVVNDAPEQITVPPLPENYQWANNYLIHYVQSKDGLLEPFKFSRTLYYPYQRVRTEQAMYATMIRAHMPDGRLREFAVDTANLAAPADLMKVLAGKGEIFAINHKDSAMHHSAYLRDSLEALKRQAEEANTIMHYGWQDDGTFLVGERLYKPDGTMIRVLLGANAASCADHFPDPVGTLEGYADAVNRVYKDPRMLPLQYAFSSGFGSILSVFGEHTYHGLLFCLTGGATGKGKTTVAKASLYGFGDAEKMTIGAQKFTVNYPPLRMGAYHNLPVLLDEMTSIKENILSDMAYMVAQGIDKGRAQMRNGIAVQGKLATWRLSAFLTANTNMYTILSAHAANTQAEAVRVLQISVDDYDIPKFDDKAFVSTALGDMADNAGCAGEAFIKYVVENREQVKHAVRKTMETLNGAIRDERLRFYVNHAATTLVAAKINKHLGVADFDTAALAKFAVQLIRSAAGEAQEVNNQSPERAFAKLLSEMSPRIIQTYEMRSAKDGRGPEQVQRPVGSPAGRYVLGLPGKSSEYDGRLYLSKADVMDWWHVRNRFDRKVLYDYLQDEGVLLAKEERVNLGQGTNLPPSPSFCIVIDASKWANILPVTNSQLSLVSGRKSDTAEAKRV
jgi:hypothetical protein